MSLTLNSPCIPVLFSPQAPSAQRSARTFANALHFASSGAQPGSGRAEPGVSTSTSTSSTTSSGSSESPVPKQPTPSGQGQGGAEKLRGLQDPSEDEWSDEEDEEGEEGQGREEEQGEGALTDSQLLARDIVEAKRSLCPDTASLLSLYLAPHIPLHHDAVRRR